MKSWCFDESREHKSRMSRTLPSWHVQMFATFMICVRNKVRNIAKSTWWNLGFIVPERQWSAGSKGEAIPSLPKFWAVGKFWSKKLIFWAAKPSSWGNSGTKLTFWAPVISSIGNLRLYVWIPLCFHLTPFSFLGIWDVAEPCDKESGGLQLKSQKSERGAEIWTNWAVCVSVCLWRFSSAGCCVSEPSRRLCSRRRSMWLCLWTGQSRGRHVRPLHVSNRTRDRQLRT